MRFVYDDGLRQYETTKTFEGVIPNLERRWRETDSAWAREEIEKFQAEWKNDPEQAWERLINRLLDSPHYGERWAQHWLDIARYADTGGYSNDYERSNAWRYRDYVIRSFNDDKAYNQFVIEQLAGDELADEAVRARLLNSEIDPKDVERAVEADRAAEVD